MEHWFRIGKMNFPPVIRLSIEQAEILAEAIFNLWEAFNFFPVFPKDLTIQYTLLAQNFSEPVVWVSQRNTHIELCEYDTDNCPFTNQFCMCKDLDLDNDDNSDIQLGEDLPF